MFTDNEALNILLSTKTSLKPIQLDNKQIIRIFDDITGKMIHETTGNDADQSALEWLVTERNGITRVIGDTEAKDNRLSEVEAKLAATTARLDAIVTAQQPAPAETPKPRRGSRAAQPDPALTEAPV